MDYMAVSDAAELWGISTRRVEILCRTGRIPGLTKFGKAWAIPKDSPKPVDARLKSGKYVDISSRRYKTGGIKKEVDIEKT